MTPLEVLAIETLDRPLSLRILESLKQHGYSLNKATSDVTTTTTDKFNKAITEHNIYNACLYSENGGGISQGENGGGISQGANGGGKPCDWLW